MADNMSPSAAAFETGFPRITKFTAVVYCANCKLEMPHEDWPRHYRTKAHREAIRRLPHPDSLRDPQGPDWQHPHSPSDRAG